MIYELAPKREREHIWICDGDTFINKDGNFVEIKYDYDCESPREYDNLGTFYTWMNSYDSPDKPAPDLEDLFDEFDLWDEWGDGHRNPIPWFTAKLIERGYAALPVAAYEHSGVVYRAGTPSQFPDSQWDAGYAGVIFASAEKICEYRCIDEITPEVMKQVNRGLADEVEYYSAWAEGQCYGYVVTGKDGNEIDSCWGFIGDDAMENGIIEYTGKLRETSMCLDEWLEMVELVNESAHEILEGMTAEYENYAA